ncbi:MAG: hypothetical protein V3T23_01820 [Nitrososphaerales archaeon]
MKQEVSINLQIEGSSVEVLSKLSAICGYGSLADDSIKVIGIHIHEGYDGPMSTARVQAGPMSDDGPSEEVDTPTQTEEESNDGE